MFDDETPEETPMLVDQEEFQRLADNYLAETGKDWTEEEAQGIFNHMENLFFKLNLYDMAAQGILIMNFDPETKQVNYTATENAETKALQYKKNLDLVSIDKLLGSLDGSDDGTVH